MKKYLFIAAAVFILTHIQGCGLATDESKIAPQDIKQYNICLVIDGTDRLCEQNGVPQVSVEEMVGIASLLSDKGKGSMYVSYVDNNCENNKVAVYEWTQDKPVAPGEKKGYELQSKYDSIENDFHAQDQAYKDCLEDELKLLRRECALMEELAYSDLVAQQKNGSDVNGAINQAVRLLQASTKNNNPSYIILVSDGCDNVGKELKALPSNMELLIVNTNVAKHQLGEMVAKEFVTLKQAEQYIFE